MTRCTRSISIIISVIDEVVMHKIRRKWLSSRIKKQIVAATYGICLKKGDLQTHLEIYRHTHLKKSVRKLMLGRKWVFQMDNDPKHISKVVEKWL